MFMILELNHILKLFSVKLCKSSIVASPFKIIENSWIL